MSFIIAAKGLNATALENFGAATIQNFVSPTVSTQRLMLPHIATRLRAQLTRDDADGGLVRDWSAARRDQIRCLIIGRRTTENLEGAEQTDTFWELLTDPFEDILPTDRFEFDDLKAQVVGVPFVWRDRRNRPHHMQVSLRWIEG